MKALTIAFPVYNEGALAGEFIEALDKACAQLRGYQISLLVVNDGSTDDTLAQIERAQRFHLGAITVINLTRNVGHSFAVQCLVDHTPGPLTILMDADFQDDPDSIPQILELHERSGADIVRVARSEQTGGLLERFLFAGFRRIYGYLTHETRAFGTFGLYSAKAIEYLRRFRDESHRYFPGFVTQVGLPTSILTMPRSRRKCGRSKMGLRRLFRLAFDAFFSYSVLPIRLASIFGTIITGISLVACIIIICIRLFTTLAIPGWSSILSGIFLFGGIQLLFLGILGEYVARIFEQVKSRPHYFVDSTVIFSRDKHALPAR